jgi:UDP-N-acetylmuramoyl-tripeptide--D-alanyl-D-alanine ligase
MPTFTAKFLATATAGTWYRRLTPKVPVEGFSVDSRHLSTGQCFIALKTDKRDGHEFIAAALAAGASAAVVARPDAKVALPQLVVADPLAAFQAIAAAHRQAFEAPVIGISGSAGKTSTKDLLALLLADKPGEVLATKGNLNNRIGVPLTLTALAPDVHRFAVIEAGIGGPGEMEKLVAMIEPDLAIITLVGPAHLESLGSLENIAREKSLLPAGTRPGGPRFFPASCLAYVAFRQLDGETLVIAPKVKHSRSETRIKFSLLLPNAEREAEFSFTARRVSEGMANNAAIALAAALYLGVTAAEAQVRLATWQPAALRGELCQDHAGRWLYVDCYNANPASMVDALGVFVATAPQGAPRLFILGGMEELGRQSTAYHRKLGLTLAGLLRAKDLALVLASPTASRALLAGAADPRVVAVQNVAELATRFEAHKGAVFIKGSRRYQLESLLLPNVALNVIPGTAL